jgi:hypothetical protein
MITVGQVHTVQLGNPDDSDGAKFIKCLVVMAECSLTFRSNALQYKILYMEKGTIYEGLYCYEGAPDFKEADLYCTHSLEYNDTLDSKIKEELATLEKDPSNKFMIE